MLFQRVSRPCARVLPSLQKRNLVDGSERFGTHVFKGAVANKYLAKQGLPKDLLDDPSWTQHSADGVACAVLDWAKDHGASVYTHWFQPMGAAHVRHGMTSQVHNAMFTFDKDGTPKWELEGKAMLSGETDGSSHPSGGLRDTHRAGGYTILDPSSPMFLRGDTVYAPSIFVSFHGDALDEKVPLLRASKALSTSATRLLKHLGLTVDSVGPNIGLEQEFFLVPRDAYYRRPDLQFAGRTIMGKDAARGQEMSDHYMGPPNPNALECMQEIQRECMLMGIPLRTRHREVAPNQYEFAPFFGTATTQIDQNLMVMQISEEVAARHGLTCLNHEKPFNNVNGSGKHNNFSLGTNTGLNLLNAKQIAKASGSPMPFIALMSAIVSAIDKHGDLMLAAIASPGNEFRLGMGEAPPAIMSTYFGEDVTKYLEEFVASKVATPYVPTTKTVDLGIDTIAPFTTPAEDRNRTSPFPYGGHRFEFRAVGSSANTSLVNTVLCSIFAEAFGIFADKIEAGASPEAVAIEMLESHKRVIFNGDNYCEANQEMLTKRGIWRIDAVIDAQNRLIDPKNIALFEKLKVLSKEECESRASVQLGHYTGIVEIEANTMVDMIRQHVLPDVKKAQLAPAVIDNLTAAVASVQKGLASVHAASDDYSKASAARTLRLETMVAARAVCDEAEAHVPAELWTLATYKELLFLDSHLDAPAPAE